MAWSESRTAAEIEAIRSFVIDYAGLWLRLRRRSDRVDER
jgi:hypothetical protein